MDCSEDSETKTTSCHPRVFFALDNGTRFNVGWGFLSILDGVAWLAATLEDAEIGIISKMHRLNARLLQAHTDENGEQYFHYRAALYAQQ